MNKEKTIITGKVSNLPYQFDSQFFILRVIASVLLLTI